MNEVLALIGVLALVIFLIVLFVLSRLKVVNEWLLPVLVILSAIATMVFMAREPRRSCPKCGILLPKFRVPKNQRQFLQGGWTCPNCGTELDKEAKPVEQ